MATKAILVEPNASLAKLDMEVSQMGMWKTEHLEPQASDRGTVTSRKPRQTIMVVAMAVDQREVAEMRPGKGAQIAGDVELAL